MKNDFFLFHFKLIVCAHQSRRALVFIRTTIIWNSIDFPWDTSRLPQRSFSVRGHCSLCWNKTKFNQTWQFAGWSEQLLFIHNLRSLLRDLSQLRVIHCVSNITRRKRKHARNAKPFDVRREKTICFHMLSLCTFTQSYDGISKLLQTQWIHVL